MICVIGNDFDSRRPRRAHDLQALDDDAAERVANGIEAVRGRGFVAGVDDDTLARQYGWRHAVAVGVENKKPARRRVQLLADKTRRKHPAFSLYRIGVTPLFAHFACGQAAAAKAGAGVELRYLAGRRTERLVMRGFLAQDVAQFDVATGAGAGKATPQQNLLRRVAEMAGKRLKVIEPEPNLAVLKTRELLLRNPR